MAVPAGAMFKYKKAFIRKDKEQFGKYIKAAVNGAEKIHSEVLFPYEILRPYFRNSWSDVNTHSCSNVLEALWNQLPSEIDTENAICVVDTSGSMFWGGQGKVLPALIAVSLGLYHAERCKGAFHNHFITFESKPHLMKIRGKTLADRLRYITNAPWGGSTDLEAVFDLLLDTAIESDASQEEIPSTLYIISDMEFNCAVRDPDKTVFENAKERFEAHGYQLPVVVFINVNSWQMQTPVRAHDKGTAIMSGASVHSFKKHCDVNTTPLDHMYKILMRDRYKEVHA